MASVPLTSLGRGVLSPSRLALLFTVEGLKPRRSPMAGALYPSFRILRNVASSLFVQTIGHLIYFPKRVGGMLSRDEP